MNRKIQTGSLLFSIIGTTIWLVGNLYEAVVIAPNLLTDSFNKIVLWRNFFTVTNPIFFYIPIAPIAVLLIFVLYLRTSTQQVFFKRQLLRALIYIGVALALGIYIITQINIPLFFGDVTKVAGDVHHLSVTWNVLNVIRALLVAFSLYHLFTAYLYIKRSS